jgi:hypothetical protein
VRVEYNPGNDYPNVINKASDTVSIIGIVPQPFEGILDFGNNINTHVHQNSRNNVGGQSGNTLAKTSFKDNL